jgi:hypothetical protein
MIAIEHLRSVLVPLSALPFLMQEQGVVNERSIANAQ